MADRQPPQTTPDGGRRWPLPGALLLGLLSAFGLLAFVLVYGLVLDRRTVPQVVAQPGAGLPGPKGDPGPRGERGPPGPRGDPGIRAVKLECAAADCSVRCDDDEVLLTAHCGIGRTPAVYTSQQSALCRSRGTAKVEVVAACVKLSPQ